jgi:ferredoxin
MPKKYHIKPQAIAPRFIPVGRSGIIDFEEDCLKCTTCVKKRCLYHVYKDRAFDSKTMSDSIDYQCKNCFSCVQNCPRGVLSKTLNPEFFKMGDDYWKPENILSTWFQAETGKIPVSGAGYRGPFSGPGFDSMWTDMSEIVRPTRDGIHGREYISTAIDIGRKKDRVELDASGAPVLDIPPLIEIPIPMLFNVLPFGDLSPSVTRAMAEAARRTGTLMYIWPGDYDASLEPLKAHLVPLVSPEGLDPASPFLQGVKMVELIHSESALECVAKLKAVDPERIVSIRLPLDSRAKSLAAELALAGVEVLHLCADYQGNEYDGGERPRFVKDALREVHAHLIDRSVRDEVTLIVSGGIALAEHMPKALICGADGAAIDVPLLIALECRVCKRCARGKSCPVEIANVSPDYGAQRIVNLMCSWWSQLIEVMGAMGIRDARRVRGEAGRAMFFEDLERETFGALFGVRKSA